MPGEAVCDVAGQICCDQRGANVAKTRRTLGEYAGQRVQKRLGRKDEGERSGQAAGALEGEFVVMPAA